MFFKLRLQLDPNQAQDAGGCCRGRGENQRQAGEFEHDSTVDRMTNEAVKPILNEGIADRRCNGADADREKCGQDDQPAGRSQ